MHGLDEAHRAITVKYVMLYRLYISVLLWFWVVFGSLDGRINLTIAPDIPPFNNCPTHTHMPFPIVNLRPNILLYEEILVSHFAPRVGFGYFLPHCPKR
jgi:hypothetical protein